MVVKDVEYSEWNLEDLDDAEPAFSNLATLDPLWVSGNWPVEESFDIPQHSGAKMKDTD